MAYLHNALLKRASTFRVFRDRDVRLENSTVQPALPHGLQPPLPAHNRPQAIVPQLNLPHGQVRLNLPHGVRLIRPHGVRPSLLPHNRTHTTIVPQQNLSLIILRMT